MNVNRYRAIPIQTLWPPVRLSANTPRSAAGVHRGTLAAGGRFFSSINMPFVARHGPARPRGASLSDYPRPPLDRADSAGVMAAVTPELAQALRAGDVTASARAPCSPPNGDQGHEHTRTL